MNPRTDCSWWGVLPYLAVAAYAVLVLPFEPLHRAAAQVAVIGMAGVIGYAWGHEAGRRVRERAASAASERVLRRQLSKWEANCELRRR